MPPNRPRKCGIHVRSCMTTANLQSKCTKLRTFRLGTVASGLFLQILTLSYPMVAYAIFTRQLVVLKSLALVGVATGKESCSRPPVDDTIHERIDGTLCANSMCWPARASFTSTTSRTIYYGTEGMEQHESCVSSHETGANDPSSQAQTRRQRNRG